MKHPGAVYLLQRLGPLNHPHYKDKRFPHGLRVLDWRKYLMQFMVFPWLEFGRFFRELLG